MPLHVAVFLAAVGIVTVCAHISLRAILWRLALDVPEEWRDLVRRQRAEGRRW